MFGWIDLRVGLRDPLVRTDEIADPVSVLRVGLLTSPVSQSHGARGVAKQRKREIEFLGKSPILVDGVEADAQYLYVFFLQRSIEIAEPATFDGSPRCIGLWIKPEENTGPREIREFDRLAVMILQLERRRHMT